MGLGRIKVKNHDNMVLHGNRRLKILTNIHTSIVEVRANILPRSVLIEVKL